MGNLRKTCATHLWRRLRKKSTARTLRQGSTGSTYQLRAGFPGETFRVLKDKEIRLYGDAKRRTSRLVLEAWDGQGQG